MINFGVIGPGKMGKLFIRDFLNIGAKLTYLKASTHHNTKRSIFAYKRRGEFIKNNINDCKFIIISSKTKTHYKYINNLFEKKNLLIEKPFFFVLINH